jgi:transcription elongation factor Elf1
MGKADHAVAEQFPDSGRVIRDPVKSPMDTHGSDWLIDAPIPCPTCGMEAVAKIAVLKARDSISCRYCGIAIDLTDPGCHAYVEELSNTVATLFSGPGEDKR